MSIPVPANKSINLSGLCLSPDAEQHVQFSCNGQTVEFSGIGNYGPMQTQDGDILVAVHTGDATELTLSFWSSANPDPFLLGPEGPSDPPGIMYSVFSYDSQSQEFISCSGNVMWNIFGLNG
ncbi:MAG TPA: hypothetical protein VF240_19615 [Pyrinomonadaceae bacterium]